MTMTRRCSGRLGQSAGTWSWTIRLTVGAALAIAAWHPRLLAQARRAAPDSADPSLLTVDRIFTSGDFTVAPMPDPHWLKDGTSYVDVQPGNGGDEIVRVNVVTGQKTVLVPASALSGIDVEAFTLSGDETKALLFHNSQRVWRRNTKGEYTVVDLTTRQLTRIAPNTTPKLFAKFSPDGRLVAYVRDNDLYVFDLAAHTERRLTTDGDANHINGTSDWVYEEEFGVRDAFSWSPDGSRIAFWHFDQSGEPLMTLTDLTDSLYPELFQYKYPKAGEPNAVVRIGVVRVVGGTTQWMQTGSDSTAYIPRMGWAGNDSLWIERMPRRQNRADLLLASVATGASRTILTDTDAAYVDAVDPVWIHDGKQLLWTSDRSGWRQLFLFDRSGALVRQVTTNGYDVLDIAGVDERRNVVYVKVAAPTPTQARIYRYPLGGGHGGPLTTEHGTYELNLVPGGRYAAVTRSAIGTPPVMALYELPAMRLVRTMADNATLAMKLRGLRVGAVQFLKIPAADGATMLDAYRVVPPNFDSTRKYPVLLYTYGGPAIPQALDAWGGSRFLFHQMLAQHGYVVIAADNRGAAWRGVHFRKMTQLRLGLVESDDQIAVAKWVGRQPWGDSARVGIWGWSYGGYNTAMSAFRGGSVFRVAISVAPVSDWRFYDSIYTERFMWVPAENADGYRASSALNYVDGLRAKYLLVFGTGDDNVHPQNSVTLAQRLQLARKPFSTMFFPNKTHSISGKGGTLPLFDLLERFVTENL